MALDAQRNWTICMAENLEQIKRGKNHSDDDSGAEATLEKIANRNEDTASDNPRGPLQGGQTVGTSCPRPAVYLPDEIIIHILEYVARGNEAQTTLGSCCLLSHQWYSASVPFLYARPYLYGSNFDRFVRTICPSINLSVRESPLAGLVTRLDMGNLVHQGSKSLTARLLGRTKGTLEEFVAPQASFAVNCFPALSKCAKLRVLDLSLVSESPPLPELFKTVSHLDRLRTFRLPRSAGFGAHHSPPAFSWPPNLEDLSLSGGIDAHFLHGVVAFPQTLRSLTIEHCPLAKGAAVTHLLRTAVRPLRRLETLKIQHMPRLSPRALDDVLFLIPQVRKLSVSVDYITPALFNEEGLELLTSELPPRAKDSYQSSRCTAHLNLRTLELTSSANPGVEDKISPIDIIIAIDEGLLPQLRQVRVAKSLLWHSARTAGEAEALADELQEASKADWDLGRGAFANMTPAQRREGQEKRVWESVAGVWMFDG